MKILLMFMLAKNIKQCGAFLGKKKKKIIRRELYAIRFHRH